MYHEMCVLGFTHRALPRKSHNNAPPRASALARIRVEMERGKRCAGRKISNLYARIYYVCAYTRGGETRRRLYTTLIPRYNKPLTVDSTAATTDVEGTYFSVADAVRDPQESLISELSISIFLSPPGFPLGLHV